MIFFHCPLYLDPVSSGNTIVVPTQNTCRCNLFVVSKRELTLLSPFPPGIETAKLDVTSRPFISSFIFSKLMGSALVSISRSATIDVSS
jgi:hypothetical protein